MSTINAIKTVAGFPTRGKTFLISGPCSVETEEQVHQTIDELFQYYPKGVDLIRGGIWKPRTRPNAFEGVGEIGLKWLVDSGKKHQTPVCTEVANAHHVEMALKAGVDSLWIGARTTVNPFSVQEIAESLKGINLPIFVKNPINPDVELWIGAIERLQNVGLNNVAAIHRGFSPFEKTIYRNLPKWDIPITFKQKLPDIPIICDPSHICGRRDLLQNISQQALDLTMDGLMIECHRDPDNAWSDAAQQLTPLHFSELIDQLVIRKVDVQKEICGLTLTELRNKIDLLDEQIFKAFANRMELARAIGKIKKENNITILQLERWKEIVDNRKNLTEELKLNDTFIEALLSIIHEESMAQQNSVMNISNTI